MKELDAFCVDSDWCQGRSDAGRTVGEIRLDWNAEKSKISIELDDLKKMLNKYDLRDCVKMVDAVRSEMSWQDAHTVWTKIADLSAMSREYQKKVAKEKVEKEKKRNKSLQRMKK